MGSLGTTGLAAAVDGREVDVDGEGDGELEAVVEDAGRALALGRRVEFVDVEDREALVLLDSPVMRNARPRTLTWFHLPVTVLRVLGDDLDSDHDILRAVPGLVRTGIGVGAEHQGTSGSGRFRSMSRTVISRVTSSSSGT
ncbi:hypothetical protein ACH49_06830 [Streptomyces leeuwenhoekii]|uniref:Uncharacterized protein n=1 Tax=Streptomyces leeuwenhoekii TaxID=1437453 RepID=A0ABR5I2T9_STRLW|nr:hypothetical protein ACH49_06830 [Streptomyces leeuwenhoekii]